MPVAVRTDCHRTSEAWDTIVDNNRKVTIIIMSADNECKANDLFILICQTHCSTHFVISNLLIRSSGSGTFSYSKNISLSVNIRISLIVRRWALAKTMPRFSPTRGKRRTERHMVCLYETVDACIPAIYASSSSQISSRMRLADLKTFWSDVNNSPPANWFRYSLWYLISKDRNWYVSGIFFTNVEVSFNGGYSRSPGCYLCLYKEETSILRLTSSSFKRQTKCTFPSCLQTSVSLLQ